MQAYRFALDLNPTQERAVLAHAGAGRKAYNWVLARVKAVMDQRTAERSYGLTDEHLTKSIGWSLPALRKAWNAQKGTVAPWWPEVSKEAFNTGLDALARGLKNWSDSRAGKRAGRKIGFPQFKAKHRSVPSVRFTTGAIRVEPDRMHVVDTAQTRLRVLGRALSRKQGPDRKAGKDPSNRWLRASARLRKAHARVANQRRDGLHKLTTSLAREHGIVVVEDVHVAGMLRNRRLARRVADAGFGEIRRQLAYKTTWNGGRLHVADRWYPSSKTCSGCGAVKTKLTLSERSYHCTTCGLILDRDLNAARNLAALVAAESEPAGSGPVAARGADQKTRSAGQVAVKRDPGTASADKAGTVPRKAGLPTVCPPKHTER